MVVRRRRSHAAFLPALGIPLGMLAAALRDGRCPGGEVALAAPGSRPTGAYSGLCVFFDVDDCLYRNQWATAERLTESIEGYCTQRLGLPPGKAYQLYQTYGTAIHGLLEEKLIHEEQVEEYLESVHDVPLDEIQPDPLLRELILAIPHPRWAFTASTASHARRCLRRLGLDDQDCFQGVISACSAEARARLGLAGKRDPRCFRWAMETAGVPQLHGAACVLIDDSPLNLRTAKELGWRTVLVGLSARDAGAAVDRTWADFAVDSIHELREAVPELFRG